MNNSILQPNTRSIDPVYQVALFFIGLGFGIDQLFSRILGYPQIAVPFIIVPVLIFILKDRFKFKLEKFEFWIVCILIYGTGIALIRYQIHHQKLSTFPILRQFIGLFLGLIVYRGFRLVTKRYAIEQVCKIIIVTSIPFLLYGINQALNQNMIAGYLRISSTFSEPSYFGDYLTLILIPSLMIHISSIRKSERNKQYIIYFIIVLTFINVYLLQSTTALLKIATLAGCFLLFHPLGIKTRLLLIITLPVFVALILLTQQGYIKSQIDRVILMYTDSTMFFQSPTVYDRIYPLYASLKRFQTADGFLGLGFGGDYFEFSSLFPKETHAELLRAKPSLSYFNSFASKSILYFGIFGFALIVFYIKTAWKTRHTYVKISFFSVIIAAFWGVSNFSLPYIWFWLAYSLYYNEKVKS